MDDLLADDLVLCDEIVLELSLLRLSFVSNFGVDSMDDDDRDELFGLRPNEERLLLVSDCLLSKLLAADEPAGVASSELRFGLINE